MSPLLVFSLDHLKCALPLESVTRSYRAVEVTPLPGAPEKVMGIINVHGVVHSVIDLRICFGLPSRPTSPADHLVIGQTSRRQVALAVDNVAGVMECPPQAIDDAASIIHGLESVIGIARMPDGMVLIHDLDSFLSLEEEDHLDRALGA